MTMTTTEQMENVEAVLTRRGLKLCWVDGPGYVELDFWSSLADAPISALDLDVAGSLLAAVAERIAGGHLEKRVTGVHLSVMVDEG